jgi:hypothetical protein
MSRNGTYSTDLGKGYSLRDGVGDMGERLSTDCRSQEAMIAIITQRLKTVQPLYPTDNLLPPPQPRNRLTRQV